jgi:mycothiol system anti-sigma-R factor
MANCSETIADLTAYLDGELPESRLGELREHLDRCLSCDDRACFEEKLKALIRERCTESMPVDMLSKIRARISQVEV